jgi:protease-4
LNNKPGLTFDGGFTQIRYPPSLLTRVRCLMPKNDDSVNSVNRGYESFTSKAAKGRNMSIEDLKAIASGRFGPELKQSQRFG